MLFNVAKGLSVLAPHLMLSSERLDMYIHFLRLCFLREAIHLWDNEQEIIAHWRLLFSALQYWKYSLEPMVIQWFWVSSLRYLEDSYFLDNVCSELSGKIAKGRSARLWTSVYLSVKDMQVLNIANPYFAHIMRQRMVLYMFRLLAAESKFCFKCTSVYVCVSGSLAWQKSSSGRWLLCSHP